MPTAPVIFNAADFGYDIQRTLDHVSPPGDPFLKRGGLVYLPRKQYVVQNPLVVRGGRITLVGENLDTLIHPSKSGVPLIRIDGATAHDFRMETLYLMARDGVTGNVGIECIGSKERNVSGLSFENVQISGLEIGAKFEYVDFPLFERCGVDHCKGDGMTFLHASQITVRHSFIQRNGGNGIRAQKCLGFYFQGPGLQANGIAQLDLIDCHSVEVTRSDIEEFKTGIVLDGCRGVVIQGCVFLPQNNLPGQQLESVWLLKPQPGHDANSSVVVMGNTFFGSDDADQDYARTIGVKAEPESCTDIFLAANGPGSAGPARLTLYDIAPGPRQFVQGYWTGNGFESQPSTKRFTAS